MNGVAVFEQVLNILSEIVMGGMVLETNMHEISSRFTDQDKLEKSEVSITCVCDLVAVGVSNSEAVVVHNTYSCLILGKLLLRFKTPLMFNTNCKYLM